MTRNKIIKTLLIILTILYGSLFLITFISPYTIEKYTQPFLKKEIAKQTHEKIDAIYDSKIFQTKLLTATKKKLEAEKKKLQKLHQKVEEKLTKVVLKMQNLSSDERNKYKSLVQNSWVKAMNKIKSAIQKVETFMYQSYVNTIEKLLKDLRIFSGTNFLIILLLTFLLFYNKLFTSQLELLAEVVIVTTLIGTAFYFFNQNWFLTMLLNDYVGFTYLIYWAILFSFLIDIAFNKARVTTLVAEAISAFFRS